MAALTIVVNGDLHLYHVGKTYFNTNLSSGVLLYDTDYTVVRNDKGEYTYAQLSPDEKTLVPTDEKVGKSSPKHPKLNGWKKDIRPKKNDVDKSTGIILDGEPAVTAPKSFKQRKRCHRGRGGSCDKTNDFIPFSGTRQNRLGTSSSGRSEDHHRRTAEAQTIGTLNNLVILLRFDDHANQKRSVPSKNDITVLMNSVDVDENLAPTGSLKMIYEKNSYGLLTIESEVTDWINLKNTEKYYADGASGTGSGKLHEALKYALDELERNNFNFTQFDADGDGNIDCITFLTSGYGAEWGNGMNDFPPHCL